GPPIGDSDKPDKGDGDTKNDFDYFVPFYKDDDGNYYKNFSFEMKDWDDAEGQYIFRIGADLTSIYWKLTNKPEDSEEKWHAIPWFFGHNGLKADYIEGKALAQPPQPPPPCDDEKPLIIATQPSEQDVISQGTISEVWAKLIDMPTEGGSGIDFAKSEIFLVDSFDQKIGGKKINDGIDTIYWILDNPLDNSKPGSYTIKIRPVDREGNGVLDDYQKATFQIKDIMKPDVFNPSPTGVVISPFEDVIYCFISDVGLGDSGIDSLKTTMSLKKEEATFTLVQTYSPTGKNSGKLMGELGFPLLDDGLWDGTYTVSVKAYDGAGNYNLYQWSFYLKTIFPIIFDPWPTGTVYTPYTGTISTGISELDKGGSGINWNESTIMLLDPMGVEVSMDKTYSIGTSTNIGRLIGRPGTLTQPGTWTIITKAYDNADHCKVGTATFNLRRTEPIFESFWPSFQVQAPYSGTISVDLRVEEGKPGIDTSTLKLSLNKGVGVVTLTTTYIGGTSSGKLIGTPTSVLLEGEYTIFATASDLASNLASYTSSFSVVWKTPIVSSLNIFPSIFSPYTSSGEFDTVTITFVADEDGTYTLTVDGKSLKDATGFLKAGSETLYIWDGKDINGLSFPEGSRTLVVSVTNQGGRTGTRSAIIVIDSIPPGISDIAVSDYIFSPGNSFGIQDTIDISFSLLTEDGQFGILIDGIKIKDGFIEKNATFTFNWNGQGFPEGWHIVEVVSIDTVGNRASKTTSILIDNTLPEIEDVTENTGGRTFFRDEVVVFILETSGTDTAEARCILNGKEVLLNKIQEELWQGSYRITEDDQGVWEIKGYITDEGGNPGINNGTVFGTITLDGTKANPITTSRIARLGIIPEMKEERVLSNLSIIESTTETLRVKWQDEIGLIEGQRIEITSGNYIWITTLENQEALISNAELYYGLPISDYKSITPQAGYSLKSLLKGGDKLIISLASFKVEKTISAILTKTTTNITITSSGIKQGRYILVSDSIHSWFLQAKEDGTCTISNQNLYSGPLVSSYNTISNLVVEEVNWATGGDASADLGVMYQGIQLVDNGMSSFFDKMPGDGVYSGFYEIKEGNSGTGVLIQGHFIYNNYNALNDPYIDERIKIDVDGTKPEIKNQNIEPNPFNPYIQNLSIKYNLSEISRVQINILNEHGEVVKNIISPNPKYGENISDFWDGRDNNGDIVPDGTYYYTIDGKDMAGNEATKVKGEIKVISIEIKIENLTFSSNPFYSDDIPESCDVLVKFRAVLKSSNGKPVTDKQLNNLGFDFVQDSNSLNIPYGLLNFETHNDKGEKIPHTSYPDMSAGNDIDPWLFGFPNYGDYDYSLGDSAKPDKGDEDTENDNGTLVSFSKDEEGNYYCDYEYGELDWKNPPGNYYVRVWAELVSIYWELTSKEDEEEEKWHAEPRYHGHYKLRSDVVDGIMRCVENPEIIEQDKTAPIVISSSPTSGEEKEIGIVSSVWVKLYDGENGVGVSPINSSIHLEDKSGEKIGGVLTNDNKDTLYWTLTKPLTIPGTYIIKITAVDFNNNKATYSITFNVTDSIPPTISDPYPSPTATSPFSGPIGVNLSEIGCGESGINWASSTISLKKDGLDIPLTKSYTETGSNTGQLKGNLISPLTESGTYTISVSAYDNKGNLAQETFYFSIPEEIEVIYNDETYLNIPYDTEIIPPSKNISIGTNTIFVMLLPDTLDHKEYKLIGSITKFYYGTQSTPLYKCKFSKDVTLTLHYEDSDVPSGIKEESLAIYGTGSGWVKLGGTTDPANNKISLKIPANTEIKDMYAIMYGEDDLPNINHTPPSVAFVNEPINITAIITDEGIGLDYGNITLSYQTVGSETFKTIAMEGSDTFSCQIPGQASTGILAYKISAVDINGNTKEESYQINVTTRETVVYTAPNPAKGSTKFNFFLETNANVKIKLYTITGDLVWDYEGDFEGGKRDVPYNCTNKDGKKLGTGLYIYKATIEYPTRTERVIKKMVIIKQ
ncbi:MAG: FlgD immunoglobulin-like domain containing protein, partial [bacterium]